MHTHTLQHHNRAQIVKVSISPTTEVAPLIYSLIIVYFQQVPFIIWCDGGGKPVTIHLLSSCGQHHCFHISLGSLTRLTFSVFFYKMLKLLNHKASSLFLCCHSKADIVLPVKNVPVITVKSWQANKMLRLTTSFSFERFDWCLFYIAHQWHVTCVCKGECHIKLHHSVRD